MTDTSIPSESKGQSRFPLSSFSGGLTGATVVGVPIFYALGLVYSNAYWSRLGVGALPSDAGPDDLIFLGFRALVTGTASVFGASGEDALVVAAVSGLLAAVLVTLGCIVAAWLRAVAHGAALAAHRWRETHRGLIHLLEPGAVVGAVIAVVPVTVVAASVFVLVPMALAERAGIERADRDLAAMSGRAARPAAADGAGDYVIHRTHDGPRLSPIADCDGNWCVVWQDGRAIAIPLATVVHFQGRAPAEAAHVRAN